MYMYMIVSQILMLIEDLTHFRKQTDEFAIISTVKEWFSICYFGNDYS